MELKKGDIVEYNDYYFTNTQRTRTLLQKRPMTVHRIEKNIASVIPEGTKTIAYVGINYLQLKQSQEEKDTDHIIIVMNDDIFNGTREEFVNRFFSNAHNGVIEEWCRIQKYNPLVINGNTIL
jgi:hypothetical protein